MTSGTEIGPGASERWNAALANVMETVQSLDSLQKDLLDKAVYVDEETFAQATTRSRQTRATRAHERRIRALEKELDAAVAAASHARGEKKQAVVAQRMAEARTQQVIQELEDKTKVFKLNTEELHAKHQELEKKSAEVQVLKAIIESMSSQGKKSKKAS